MNPSVRAQSTLVSSLLHTTQQPAYLRLAHPAVSKCLRRPFSQTAPSSRATMGAAQVVKPKMPAQMSLKVKMKDAMASLRKDMLPDEFGLLPGTFVRPLAKNLPSIWKDYKDRWLMEKTWFRSWFMGVASVITYCWIQSKPRLPLGFRERRRVALDLHKKMYTAFAEGDTDALKKICCAGLYEDFVRRISRRPHNSKKLNWTLHKYITFPFAPNFLRARVVADRAAIFPGGEGLGIRQAVVRIRSKQSITKPVANGKKQQEASEEKQQDCTEYVVIQQLSFHGELQDWKVWGLADETTMQEVETNPAFAPGLSMAERIQMMQMGQGPGGK